jgi:predicted hydrocarbon binding protein
VCRELTSHDHQSAEEIGVKENDIKIPHLKRREIQAPLVSSLIKGFAREIGYDRAMKVVQQVINEDAILSGKRLAEQYAGNSMAELSKIVKQVWAEDDAMRIEIIRENDSELFFDVIYCGYVEIYENLGIREQGFVLSCSRDFPFVEGFNPNIELRRTKTIMEGADYCDFRFKRK